MKVNGISAGFLLLLATLVPGLPIRSAKAEPAQPPAQPTAEQLVAGALKAELLGDNTARRTLLEAALARDPDYAAARWHLGYVHVGEEWLPLEQAESRQANRPELAQYRRLRQLHGGTPHGELALARWCDEHDLADEAAFHWLSVLRSDPDHKEALEHLDLHWHHGRLMTREQIVGAQRRPTRQQRQAAPQETDQPEQKADGKTQVAPDLWQRHFNGWCRALEQDAPSALPAIRGQLSQAGLDSLHTLGRMLQERARRPGDQESVLALSLLLVEVVREKSPGDVAFLVEYAVDYPLADVRRAAAEGLNALPEQEAVPALLARMRLPIEAHFTLGVYPYGGVVSRYSFYQEGPQGGYQEVHQVSLLQSGEPIRRSIAVPGAWTTEADQPRIAQTQAEMDQQTAANIGRARPRAAANAARAQAQAIAQAVVTRQKTAAENARIADLNHRVADALRQVTDAVLADDPLAWYEWWADWLYDYYEFERPEPVADKPVYERQYCTPTFYRSPGDSGSIVPVNGSPPPTPASPPGPSMGWMLVRPLSCFPPGTTVWTHAGALPIEQVQPGDRVLSQDPATGELGYQRVLQATRRSPCPMIKLRLGDEELLSTRGHPFWVVGRGWTMAKELHEGMQLHTVRGSAVLDRVEEVNDVHPWTPMNHNLVVDGPGTYFVGRHRLLVHDNRLFQSAGFSVPGLAALEAKGR